MKKKAVPPLPPPALYNERIEVWVSGELKKRAEADAKAAGFRSVSDYGRDLFRHPPRK